MIITGKAIAPIFFPIDQALECLLPPVHETCDAARAIAILSALRQELMSNCTGQTLDEAALKAGRANVIVSSFGNGRKPWKEAAQG